jgi:hypothetical protein
LPQALGPSSLILTRKRKRPFGAERHNQSLKQIYGFAILHGEKVANPADDVGPASIATFVPKDPDLVGLDEEIELCGRQDRYFVLEYTCHERAFRYRLGSA